MKNNISKGQNTEYFYSLFFHILTEYEDLRSILHTGMIQNPVTNI